MIRSLAAVLSILSIAALGAAPAPAAAADPALCAVPEAPAITLHAAEPEIPPQAQMERAGGTVQILVALDEHSHVAGATVVKSSAAFLNASSLAAVRKSTFRTAIHDCKPVPSKYLFTVRYGSQ